MAGQPGEVPALSPVSAQEFERFFRVDERADLLRQKIALAVSGGADSAALLYLVQQQPIDLSHVTVLTVDHALREGSAAEAASVKRLTEKYGLAHHTLVWRGAKPTSDIQAAARMVRYDLMTSWCRAHGGANLWIAHTLDDQAETFLLRLARGSGVDGLSAMAPVTALYGVRLVRPLLSFPKERLKKTLMDAGIAWIEDPSNENEDFARVRMRKIMPLLAQEGLTVSRLAATAARMADAKAALDEDLAELKERAVRPHDAGFVVVDRQTLIDAPREIGMRLLAELSRCVGGNTYRPRFDRLERIYTAICQDRLGAGNTLAGCRFAPASKVLIDIGAGPALVVFRELAAAERRSCPLTTEGQAQFDGRFEVALRKGIQGKTYQVRVLGQEGWQQVKSLIETALPFEICLSLPALWQGDVVVAVPHLSYRRDDKPDALEFSAVFGGFARFGQV